MGNTSKAKDEDMILIDYFRYEKLIRSEIRLEILEELYLNTASPYDLDPLLMIMFGERPKKEEDSNAE